MGAGGSAQPSKLDRRHTALALEHERLTSAPPEKLGKHGEKLLKLSQFAAGQRMHHACETCGNIMGEVQTRSGPLLRCGHCILSRAPKPDRAGSKGSRKSSRTSSEVPVELVHPPWASEGAPSRQGSKAKGDEDSGSASGSRPGTPTRLGSKSDVVESAARASSKQVLARLGQSADDAQRNGSKRRTASAIELNNNDEAMAGFKRGDRVVFEEFDETAAEFGVGTVVGPTHVRGVLEVRFDKHENDKTFNLKADGLRKLDPTQEHNITHGRAATKMKTRSHAS